MITLKAARKAKGLTQQELARLARVARSSIIRWEKLGVTKKANIARLAGILDVRPGDLN